MRPEVALTGAGILCPVIALLVCHGLFRWDHPSHTVHITLTDLAGNQTASPEALSVPAPR